MSMRMAFTPVLALICVAGMFPFTVAFLVDWIRSFERIRGYWRHATRLTGRPDKGPAPAWHYASARSP